MKYAAHILVSVLFGFPALMLGYLWRAIFACFCSGVWLYDKHETAAIRKFVDRKDKT